MEPYGDRVGRYAHDDRNICGFDPVDVPHDEELVVALLELLESPEDFHHVRSPLDGIHADVPDVEPLLHQTIEGEVGEFCLLLACLIDDEVVGNPVEEELQAIDLPPAGEILPRSHERLLHELLRILLIERAETAVSVDLPSVLGVRGGEECRWIRFLRGVHRASEKRGRSYQGGEQEQQLFLCMEE